MPKNIIWGCALATLVLGCDGGGSKSSTEATRNEGGAAAATSRESSDGGAGRAHDTRPGGTGAAVAAGGSNGSGGSGGNATGGSGNATSHVAGLTPPGDDPSAAEACRYYFDMICARIRDCEAPAFRPCNSPADLCPDTLFSADSTWTVPEVLSCAETWTTHSCDALKGDRWPACSQRSGAREDGSPCVFDAQCQSGVCLGGMIPNYQSTCGQCVSPAPRDGACDQDTPCPMAQRCEGGVCVDVSGCSTTAPCPTGRACVAGDCVDSSTAGRCDDATACPTGQVCFRGTCLNPLPLGAACTEGTPCEEGLVCGLELAAEGEEKPTEGTCQVRPSIGEPCLPTFFSVGACAEDATCTNRPTGDCVALKGIGESCGFTQCVDGAYCNIYSTVTDVPSHTCQADRVAGEPCFGEDVICAEGLRCLCSGTDCATTVCAALRLSGESCDGVTAICAPPLTCRAGVCVIDTAPSAAGEPCTRSTTYGRVSGDCVAAVEGVECLCADPDCATSYCALPRLQGQSCNGTTEMCRQGLTCEAGQCVAVESLGLEAKSCPAP